MGFVFEELLGSFLELLFARPNKQGEGSSEARRFDCEMLCIPTARPLNRTDNYRPQEGDKTRKG
jgi:hypothetical protein